MNKMNTIHHPVHQNAETDKCGLGMEWGGPLLVFCPRTEQDKKQVEGLPDTFGWDTFCPGRRLI